MKKVSEKNKEIIRLYLEEKMSGYKIGQVFGCTSENVYRILRRFNIKRRELIESNRKKKVDTQYFNQIDTEQKAYILGFIAADGCVTDDSKLIINLHEQDKDILEKIKECLRYEGTLKYKDFSNSHIKHANQWQLTIGSKQLSSDLGKLGCEPRKTFTLKFPTEEQVPSYLISHFIRGYFDGDGCVSCTTRQSEKRDWRVSFIGTHELLIGIKNVISNTLNIKIKKFSSRHPERNNNNFNIDVGGNRQVLSILDWLYKDSTIYLNRKHLKYKEIKNYYLDMESDRAEYRDYCESRRCNTTNCNNKWHSRGYCSTCYDKYAKLPNANSNEKQANT